MDFATERIPATTALIICRVSSLKQSRDGSGLHSQAHRCMAYAATRGYAVEKTFMETVSGGSTLEERPALQDLLTYLEAQKHSGKNYVCVFDDNKRFARRTELHIMLRRKISALGAKIEYLNMQVENTPEGIFIDTMMAAHAQLEREQNGRQTKQKTKARLEKGFWTFRAPIGYKYAASKHGGKELVIDEPVASTVKQALEGFASGHFVSQAEVKRFLEADAHFPKDLPNGEVRTQTIVRLMEKVLYAGYLEAPAMSVSRRKANHPALISLETFETIQRRRQDNGYLPARKDIHEDFILRGAVCCSECNKPLTSGWSQGKYKKYAYYFCQARTCVMYGKTIPRDKLEQAFEEEILPSLQPSRQLFTLVREMFARAWDMQKEKADEHVLAFRQECEKAEKEISQLLDRLVDVTSPRVLQAYEKRIDDLENRKLVLQEKAAKTDGPLYSFEEMFELSMRFLANPHKLWASRRFTLRRMVLKLAFTTPIPYRRNEGYRTPQTSLVFKAFRGFFYNESKMVHPDGAVANQLFDILSDWETQLSGIDSISLGGPQP